MIKSFETSTSNKICSDLYGALNDSGHYGQNFFSGRYPTTVMTEIEMNGPFDFRLVRLL